MEPLEEAAPSAADPAGRGLAEAGLMADFADAAAAVAAGYTKRQVDRGASLPLQMNNQLRYRTILEKTLTLAGLWQAFGESSTSAAAADTQAVASLNANRRHRYAGPTDAYGNVLTLDVS